MPKLDRMKLVKGDVDFIWLKINTITLPVIFEVVSSRHFTLDKELFFLINQQTFKH